MPNIEWVQLALNLIGAGASLVMVARAISDNRFNRLAHLNGSAGLVARIRIRREMTKLLMHSVMLLSGCLLLNTRLAYVGAAYTIAVTRNLTISFVTVAMLMDTFFEHLDRLAVFAMVEEEQRRAEAKDRRQTDAAVAAVIANEQGKAAQLLAIQDTTEDTNKSVHKIESAVIEKDGS